MRGFTLLELLVATAVFVGLVLILVSIAASLSSFWQLGIAHNERRSSALSAFSRMARDLRFASLPPDPSVTNFQLVINPTNVGGSYLLPQAAFWQAPVASDRSRGNMALVGYFVQWVKEADVSVPKLCRLLVDSNYQTQKPSDFVSDALIASKAPATKASGYAGQLAENVLGLWIRPLDQRKDPILNDAKAEAFPSGQFDSARGYTVGITNASGTLETKVFAPALPASLEVVVVAVDARTAKRLSGDEKPAARTADMRADVDAFYNKLPQEIKRGARIYRTVIDLHSAPR
jgi:prepilin-type N-terminal cleavage/methylation domain-containing protein